eukprot:TRINITY_DN2513_c0_g1_i2.p1 TRINITY_DN2513_c0_g1~~TRINITY_DN2513_c0_g1_i2.p1  ORF type:complete len:111 (-),score=30.85 TRINITY_DN2513_c0_g1_i2:58-390(-)
MSTIINLEAHDPFADVEESGGISSSKNIHIRMQQRNGRKCLTTVTGLDAELDFKKILKAIKKEFCCNGTIVEDKEAGTVIQTQGDQRRNIAQFLCDKGIVQKDNVKVHGA